MIKDFEDINDIDEQFVEKDYDIEIDEDAFSKGEDLPIVLPVIHLNNAPIFPGLVAPIILPSGPLVKAVEIAMSETGHLALLLTKKKEKNPKISELYNIGVTGKILKKINLSDGGTSVLLQGVRRFKVEKYIKDSPFIIAKVIYLDDVIDKDIELDALERTVKSMVKSLSLTSPLFSDEMRLAMINVPSATMMSDLVMFTLGVTPEKAQEYLEENELKKKFKILISHLKKEQEVSDLQARITKEVSDKISKLQREYFLKEQLKVIKKELGLEQDEKALDISKLKDKFSKIKMSEEAIKIFNEELEKLSMIPESSPEYTVSRNYIDWILSMPWNKYSKDELDILQARKILDKYHHGLEKVKTRVLEYLAVRKLNPKYEGNILLFLGPPGVGKTSLGKAIAEAMNREFFRFSLGGMKDEAEIKGHRRTYIGAMPGKIIQGLKRVQTSNPVIMLDEVDKLGISFQGDPSSALLEVLDPEQNFDFRDHYLDVGFDLSQTLFICTANNPENIPAALYDRMELISFDGYLSEEKIEIAKKYLMPKLLLKHGLKKEQLVLSTSILGSIIDKYARDFGIRLLEKQISKIMRKVAMHFFSGKRKKIIVNADNLENYLGAPLFTDEDKRRINKAGIVTGLAWTPYGGDILFIETTNLKAKEGSFKFTGQLGDVMKESATIAYTYARKWLEENIKDNKFFNEFEVHLHLPAGAVPKDGPSAGISMCLCLISLALNKKISSTFAMTGELSIVGKVLPVGGVKEKLHAAARMGIKNVILPFENEKDLKEIPKNIKDKLNFTFVKEMKEVIKLFFKSEN